MASYKKVTVVGAGAMGGGIAQVLAAASLDVVLIDIKTEFVENGLKKIASRLESDVKKGKLSDEEKEGLLSRIKGSVDQEDARDSDLVIEAVIESRKIKGDLFKSLNQICPPETVFATNTSTLSVTDLGALSGRPGKFLGLHFFNPVNVMKLVEVIFGLDTQKEIIDEVKAVVKMIKKIPVVVSDCPGFLVNRILLAYVGEATLCAQEGISPEEIDGEAKKAGFPMGPLILTDMVGWDVCLHTLPILYEAYGERFPFPRIVKALNDVGRLGMKTGRGIYCGGKTDEGFRDLVKNLGTAKSSRPFSVDRIILRQVNEAIYCLQEGVATAEEIDRAMVLGTGFPNVAGTGGPLRWADEKGLDWVCSTLEELTKTEGTRFWPHHLLKTYVAAGRLGKKKNRGFYTY
jgi:3-hydroxyacyl-CoA dehydrogenase